MSNAVTTIERQPRSVLMDMATRYGMEPQAFEATVRATCMPPGKERDVSREQFAAFLMVAREYDLNPVTKEIYAFPTRGGGIQPIVSIDGWMSMVNDHPAFDGMEFEDHLDADGRLTAVTCRMFRKDRSRPISVIEYMAECRRSTDVWKQWPARMLRHKAAIQCARYAFGFSGIMEPDEYDRLREAESTKRPEPAGVAARLTGQTGAGFNHAQIERETQRTDAVEDAEIADTPQEAQRAPETGEGDFPGDDTREPEKAAPEPDMADDGASGGTDDLNEAYERGYQAAMKGRVCRVPEELSKAEGEAYREGHAEGVKAKKEGVE